MTATAVISTLNLALWAGTVYYLNQQGSLGQVADTANPDDPSYYIYVALVTAPLLFVLETALGVLIHPPLWCGARATVMDDFEVVAVPAEIVCRFAVARGRRMHAVAGVGWQRPLLVGGHVGPCACVYA